MNVFLLSKPSLDTKALINMTQKACNDNLARTLDSESIQLDTFIGNLLLISAFKENNSVSRELLNQSSVIQSHLHYTVGAFLQHQDVNTLTEDYEGLKVTVRETTNPIIFFCIISGTLKTWKEFIQTAIHQNFELGKECYKLFSNSGLSNLWPLALKQKLGN